MWNDLRCFIETFEYNNHCAKNNDMTVDGQRLMNEETSNKGGRGSEICKEEQCSTGPRIENSEQRGLDLAGELREAGDSGGDE
jgi:hypothetical protein